MTRSPLRSRVPAALLGAVLALPALPVLAADYVVVEAAGIALEPGASLDGGASLTLADGARLVLVSAEGTTLTLVGPFQGRPDQGAAGGGASVTQSFANLVAARGADTSALGAVRAAAAARPLPRPWLVDAVTPGHACLQPGQPAVLWRADAAPEVTLTLAPADHAWQASTPWPAGQPELALPADVPFGDGQSMLFEIGGEATAVTLHLLPASVTGEKMTAAWMAAKGCTRQAEALAKTVK